MDTKSAVTLWKSISNGALGYVVATDAVALERFAAEVKAAERERCAALVESRAGMRGTGAWVALTAAADAIRGA